MTPLGGTQLHRGGQLTTAFGHERTAFGSSVSRPAADAFYSLGTFMVLVQVRVIMAYPSLATAPVAHASNSPSMLGASQRATGFTVEQKSSSHCPSRMEPLVLHICGQPHSTVFIPASAPVLLTFLWLRLLPSFLRRLLISLARAGILLHCLFHCAAPG